MLSNSNFSGILYFQSHATTGRLDIFSTEPNGAEVNEIQEFCKLLIMKYILHRIIFVLPISTIFVAPFMFIFTAQANADTTYNPAYLISDSIFTDTSSMSQSTIQSFLVNENSGLKNYYDVENCGSSSGPHYSFYATYYSCAQSVLASKIIYDSSQAYGINPRAILATMEKEQSLVTTPNPTQSQLNCAMGYLSCGTVVGFFNQVDNGTWQFRADIDLMNGQNYWGYTPSSYPCSAADSYDHPELYSTGLYPGNNVTFSNPAYNGDPAGPGGYPMTFVLGTSATAALYCYTPYVGPLSQTGYSGSYNFVYYFELWFGSVASACYNEYNLPTTSGAAIVRDSINSGQPNNLALTFDNNTGSDCSEIHVWNSAYQSFINDYATNLPSFDPTTGQIISADNLYENGQNRIIFVKYNDTGSGRVEIHVWNPTYKNFDNDYATNIPEASPAIGNVISGDFYGNGQEELAYIKYQNTGSGKVEIHIWNSNFTGFINDYATNVVSNPPNVGEVIAANLNNNIQSNLIYIKYQNTGSGKVEIHIWNSNFTGFINDYATNVVSNPPNVGEVLAANINGIGKDSLIYGLFEGTGSGKVEIHIWNSNFTGFINDYATNVHELTNN